MNNNKYIYFLLSMIILILIWQSIILIGDYEEALFPSPLVVLHALIELISSGTLYIHLKASLFRFTIGYFLAALIAITLGFIISQSRILIQITHPMLQVLRPISPVAWSPFIVLFFGIGNMPAIIIIFIAAFFPIILLTLSGVKSVEGHYLKIAKNLEFNKFKTLYKIVFPASLPSIMSGLHIALGTAWIFLVAGEMVGAQSGLGYLIVDSRNTLDLDYVFAGIIVIGLSGFILDQLLTAFELIIKRYTGFL